MDDRLFRPNAYFVDLVINHPSVRPTTQQGFQYLSSEETLKKPGTFVYAFGGGVALFQHILDYTYDGHIFVLEGSRGSRALAFGHAALARLARDSDARQLRTGVPLALPAARLYCRRLGLKSESRDLFNEYFSAEVSQWAAS